MSAMTMDARPGTIGEIAPGPSGSVSAAGWPLASDLPPLGALTTAPAAARARVRATLTAWGAEEIADAAEFVASELVTNAVRASMGPDGGPAYVNGRLPVIWLRLFSDRTLVMIEVWDQAPGIPAQQDAHADAESGRGLWLVDELTGSRWGWRPVPDGPGKCVWAEIAADGIRLPLGKCLQVHPPYDGAPFRGDTAARVAGARACRIRVGGAVLARPPRPDGPHAAAAVT